MRLINNFNYNKYWNMFTDDFRKMGEKMLGELSTPLSFMYLFRRFGTPQYNNNDEYKILYEYKLKHKDLIVSIHASYHEFVYFNLLVPKKYEDLYCNSNKEFHKKLVIKALDNNLAYMPYCLFPPKYTELTKEQEKLHWEIVNKEAKTFFPKDDFEYISNYQNTECEHNSKDFDLINSLSGHLCNKFRAILTPQEIDRLNNWMPQLANYQELNEQAISFFDELKKGVWVRDVDFNIIGYSSANNIIKKHIN